MNSHDSATMKTIHVYLIVRDILPPNYALTEYTMLCSYKQICNFLEQKRSN
jgi:hypothetical protein